MAAYSLTSQSFSVPDLSGLSADEKQQVLSVMKKARDFEAQEEMSLMLQPLEGQLYKYTNVMKGWQYRWFVLEPGSGKLDYYEKEEQKTQKARGTVQLAGAVISPSDEDSQTFTVNAANGEIYRLRALDAKERQHWVNRLRATAEHHTEAISQNWPTFQKDAQPPITNQVQMNPHILTRNNSGSLDSLQTDVANRVNLLVEQKSSTLPNISTSDSLTQENTQHLKTSTTNKNHKLSKSKEGKSHQSVGISGTDASVKSKSGKGDSHSVFKVPCERSSVVVTRRSQHKHVQSLSVNHQGPALVSASPAQLITASVSDECFKNVQDMLDQVHTQENRLISNMESLPASGEPIGCLDQDLLLLKATSGATLTCLEQCLSILQQQQVVASHTNSLPYSTNIEWFDSKSPQLLPPVPILDPVSPSESFVSATDIVCDNTPRGTLFDKRLNDGLPFCEDSEVEDTMEYTDTELGAVDEHKSIILHLLSQLKLGMDLTKVVLPTFILEKRSLLELFADCMAHADIFIGISDLPSPEERILGVVEWYLTSFHASRKGSIAKKPYNPIIGETFHCSWHVTSDHQSCPEQITDCHSNCHPATNGLLESAEQTISADDQMGSSWGQINSSDVQTTSSEGQMSSPEGQTGSCGDHLGGESTGGKPCMRLRYCAEQVSHHPPVSSFYIECPEKSIYMNTSIWTKSKFMGMSIGVVMVGKVHLHLVDLGEEYELSLPSAYARSILTVPWVELGDKINISCQKTGYSASVTFHTKPFYGGKLHKVTSEVKRPDGEVFCKISGEWNGVLDFAYTDGRTKSIDTTQMVKLHKCVRPITAQSEFESRKLWQHVTESLKKGDIDSATQHKRFLEERQRQGERHRKDTNSSFPTKYFHKEGDSWVYNNQLKSQTASGS